MAYANKADYKKWYMANRERLIAKARAAELANPKKAAQKKRAYLEWHPDRRKETNSRYMKKFGPAPAGCCWALPLSAL